MIKKVIVLGGGSAGNMAAAALKTKAPWLDVQIIRSKDIGIIGVGEGSTVVLTKFLHEYLKIGFKKFIELAKPTWKLGLKFLWGPRPYFNYTFSPMLPEKVCGLPHNIAYYAYEDMEYEDPYSAIMTHDRAFPPMDDGNPYLHGTIAYHFQNEHYVEYLEGYNTALGVVIKEDLVQQVLQNEHGIAGLVLKSGTTETADLYLDASGFASVLLGKTLQEPFQNFKSSLYNNRAIIGGWDRADDEIIKPYTTCQSMNSGWCWQIDHQTRINRGYVHSTDFTSEEEAEREFRAVAPKVTDTKFIKFVSGRYDRAWVKNVVAIGNASGFVEPLEATALGVIAIQSRFLADVIVECRGEVPPSQKYYYNNFNGRNWDGIRKFLSIHYKFNKRFDTPYWRACWADADLAGAEPIVQFYRENGPSTLWAKTMIDYVDTFGITGYLALLVGQKIPFERKFEPTAAERETWQKWRQRNKQLALGALNVRQSLDKIEAPGWKWNEPKVRPM
jgi:tryptophan 7-halogenase